jgi:hypothetical protein
MRRNNLVLVALAGAIGLGTGCHSNTVDQGAFKSALNSYYSGKQDCIWSSPVKFPAQADTSNDEQTRGFDALTDAGLLTRKSAEKSRFLIGSKQVNDYDLSDIGHSTWTADTSEPGYGNFCFGHLEVTSIDGYTPADPNAATYTVTYHYGVNAISGWAKSQEIKTAFPKIETDSNGQHLATAYLEKSNDGWLVQKVQPGTPGT